MKRILQLVSFLGLGLTVIPSFRVFGGHILMETHLTCMLIGMLLWFLTAPVWMRKQA